MTRKHFLKHNEGFKCRNCGFINNPAGKSERDHCAMCLFSLHVDEETPGDRMSDCEGLMQPFGIDHAGGKGFMIIHKCVKCGKSIRSRVMEDDDALALSKIN